MTYEADDDTDDDELPPFQRHSDTSREAAIEAMPNANTQRHRVLLFIKAKGLLGATDEEIQLALNMNPSTQRPRRIELVEKGFVCDSQIRRPTLSGRQAVVWGFALGPNL